MTRRVKNPENSMKRKNKQTGWWKNLLQSIWPSVNNPTVCLQYLKQPRIMTQHN